jgi:hypothetical protein
LLPNNGVQNPTAEQQLIATANQLLQVASANKVKDPAAFRDKVLDAMFGGPTATRDDLKIKNFNWRSIVAGDPVTKEYRNAKTRLNRIWQDVQSSGIEKYKRDSYGFTEYDTPASAMAAMLDNMRVIVDQNAKATTRQNAANVIDQTLDSWGLGKLKGHYEDLIWNQGLVNTQTIQNMIRETKEYKERFKGMIEHNKKYPLKLTEGAYLGTENQMMQVAEQYLPKGFFTLAKASELIGKGVDVTDFNQRVLKGYAAAAAADPATRRQLEAQGVDLSHLAAYFLDPTLAEPFLTKQVAKATLRGYAENVGLTDFTPQMASELADRVRNASNNPYGTFTMQEAQKAIDFAAANQGLAGTAPGANTPVVNTNQLIGSRIEGFQGTKQNEANTAVTMAQQAQEAPFSKGGGYDVDNQGVTGVGSAPE